MAYSKHSLAVLRLRLDYIRTTMMWYEMILYVVNVGIPMSCQNVESITQSSVRIVAYIL